MGIARSAFFRSLKVGNNAFRKLLAYVRKRRCERCRDQVSITLACYIMVKVANDRAGHLSPSLDGLTDFRTHIPVAPQLKLNRRLTMIDVRAFQTTQITHFNRHAVISFP